MRVHYEEKLKVKGKQKGVPSMCHWMLLRVVSLGPPLPLPFTFPLVFPTLGSR